MRINWNWAGLAVCVSIVAILASFAATTSSAAEAYIIVDDQSGKILGSKGANDKRQVASLTKVATALVVLDWARVSGANLGELVPITGSAVSVGGINPAGFMVGDMVSMRDLLYSALMASDNIAAHSLAAHVGTRLPKKGDGSAEGNFVAQMNALAANLGMRRTRFMNPSGLDTVGKNPPFSTAADMARLTRYAFEGASFPFYVSQKTREIQVQRNGQLMNVWLRNTNPLLDQIGIDGVKTGRTARAGDCIILSSDRPPEARQEGEQTFLTPRRVIVVILGSSNREIEGLSMMNRAWQLYDNWAAGGRKVSNSDRL